MSHSETAMPVKEWISERLKVDYVSQKAKRALLPEYIEEGLPSQSWGFARLYHIRKEMQQKGQDITFLVGEHKSFQAPEIAYEAAKKAIDDRFVKYAAYPEFVEAVAQYLKRRFKMEVDPHTELMAIGGTNMGIKLALEALVDPGDEVLIIDPDYACYESMARFEGAKVIPVPHKKEKGQWRFDPEELEKRVTSKTKLLMLTNPNNPDGYVYKKGDLEAISALAVKKDFFVLSDELYADQIYDSNEPHFATANFPGMSERTVTISGFSKCFWMSGFRIGYIVANKELMLHIGNGIRWAVQRAPSIGQKAATAVLTWPGLDAWRQNQIRILRHARDFMVKIVNEIDNVTCNTCEASPYLFPDFSRIMKSSQEMAEYLMREARVFVLPGYMFGRSGEGYIRLHLARPDDDIKEQIGKIEKAVKKLKK